MRILVPIPTLIHQLIKPIQLRIRLNLPIHQVLVSGLHHLPLDLRNADNLDADHGSVTVTLEPAQDTDPYQVNDARDDATVTIYDNNTPKLSITNADQVFSGVTAMFTITSDIKPWQNLDIVFTPTESAGNFLDTTNNPSADAEWTASGQEFTTDSPYMTTLEVPTADDPAAGVTSGEITITLVEESGSDNYKKDYIIDTAQTAGTTPPENHKATVSVIDEPIPELSIVDVVPAVNEGETITVTVRANKDPLRKLKLSFTPEDTTSGIHSYLDTTPDPDVANDSGQVRETDLITFAPESGQNYWTAEIMVQTKTDSLDNDHGSIKISLTLPGPNSEYAGDYTISGETGEDHVVVTVRDVDIPVITIANANPNDILAGDNAKFTLTSNINVWQPIYIKFIPSESRENFLSTEGVESNGGAAGAERTTTNKITFLATGQAPNQTFVATDAIKIKTAEDTMAGVTSGEVTITLVNEGSDYTINTSAVDPSANPIKYRHQGTVQVEDVPNPVLTITSVATSVDEGDQAIFEVSTPTNPKRELVIKYGVQNQTGDYYTVPDDPNTPEVDTVELRSVSRTLTKATPDASMYTARFSIQTRTTNNMDNDHGTVRVSLRDSDTDNPYTVATGAGGYADLVVHDDSTPQISINNAADVYAGSDATFTLESSIQPAGDQLTIRYKPVIKGTTTFLNFTRDGTTYDSDDIWDSVVTFGPDPDSTLQTKPIIGRFTIPTQEDTDASGGTGVIEVALHADNNESPTPARYELLNPSATPATVDVNLVPITTLSIRPNGNSVAEGGGNAEFIVSTPVDPINALLVKYTPTHTYTEASENYIDTTRYTIDPANPSKEVTLNFQPNTNDPPDLWTATISIPLRDKDNVDTADGTIQIELNTLQTALYAINTTNDNHIATISVLDQNIPVITIIDAPETLAGGDAMFKLSADITPRIPLKISYKPTNVASGNFLDTTAGGSGADRRLGEGALSEAEALTFDDTNSSDIHAFLEVLTKSDAVNDSGSITVELLNNSDRNYEIDDSQIAGSRPG